MKHRPHSNQPLGIVLHDEKFYFPRDILKGTIIVHPKTPTRTNHLLLRFTGEIILSIKDKKTISLFQITKILAVSKSGKAHVLEARQHHFPFEFVVPGDLNLPSSMEHRKNASVRYRLTVVQDRPLVLESLSPKIGYSVPILELIDVNSPQLSTPQERIFQVCLPNASTNNRSYCKVSMDRTGFTRGAMVCLIITISHSGILVLPKALSVELIQVMEIQTDKNCQRKEDVLRSRTFDLNIIGPFNFSQSIPCQLTIPTSTPPSTAHISLKIDYKIRVRFSVSNKRQAIDIPMVVGTWPPTAVPIDDEDDEEIYRSKRPTMVSDIKDDEDNEDDEEEEEEESRESISDLQYLQLKSSRLRLVVDTGVGRSGSGASRLSSHSNGSSVSSESFLTHLSWDDSSLSRNTSLSTTQSHPDHIFRRSPSSIPSDLYRPKSITPTIPFYSQPSPPLPKHGCISDAIVLQPIITPPITQTFVPPDLDDDDDDDEDEDDEDDPIIIARRNQRRFQRTNRELTKQASLNKGV
ncbi:hypothetical protein CLU79DRAFT_833379 [Phycomyces nitens]|nr:hypothetical protein CLU79DRAFT_833379 [Phycomyces nitens]